MELGGLLPCSHEPSLITIFKQINQARTSPSHLSMIETLGYQVILLMTNHEEFLPWEPLLRNLYKYLDTGLMRSLKHLSNHVKNNIMVIFKYRN